MRAHINDLGAQIIDLGAQFIDVGAQINDLGTQITDLGAQIMDLGTQLNDLGMFTTMDSILKGSFRVLGLLILADTKGVWGWRVLCLLAE